MPKDSVNYISIVVANGAELRECIRKTSCVVTKVKGGCEVQILDERLYHDEVRLKVQESDNGFRGWLSKNEIIQIPKRVRRGNGNAGKRVIGLLADGRVLREGDDTSCLAKKDTILKTNTSIAQNVEEPKTYDVTKASKESDVKQMLKEADQECYGGEPRDGGGPDPANQVEASLLQLLNRLKYHNGRAGSSAIVAPELIELVNCSTSKPALEVVARQLLCSEINKARRNYGKLSQPSIPIWATRDILYNDSKGAKVRLLHDTAGAVWRDPIDGGTDDWIEYQDIDALPPKKAEYSPSRQQARWTFLPDTPPTTIVCALRSIHVPKPSKLDPVLSRGGAALDDFGYAWGQTYSDAWLSVPIENTLGNKFHIQCRFQSRHLLLAFRLPLIDNDQSFSHLIDTPLFASINSSEATWHLERESSFSILTLSFPKIKPAWWQALCIGHPRIRPRDFDFMV